MDGLVDGVGMMLVTQMVQHIHGSVQHGNRVGHISSGNRCACVTGSRLENSILSGENHKILSNAYFQRNIENFKEKNELTRSP